MTEGMKIILKPELIMMFLVGIRKVLCQGRQYPEEFHNNMEMVRIASCYLWNAKIVYS